MDAADRTTGGRPPARPARTRRRTGLALVGLLAGVGAAAAGAVVVGSTDGAVNGQGRCAPRVIAVDPSSSVDPTSWDTASELIAAAGRLAAVCATTVYAAAAVPGRTVTILADDDLAPLRPVGPNRRVRESRFTDGDAARITAIVHDRLAAVVTELPADRSDLVALLTIAADRSAEDTEVIVVSDGVHRDDAVDVDRPLAAGEGPTLAAALRPPALRARRVQVVGVGEVDASAAAPSSVWVGEVRAFVAALCGRTGVDRCDVRGATSVSEALA